MRVCTVNKADFYRFMLSEDLDIVFLLNVKPRNREVNNLYVFKYSIVKHIITPEFILNLFN